MSTLTQPLRQGPTVAQWLSLCALGEAIGMSAGGRLHELGAGSEQQREPAQH